MPTLRNTEWSVRNRFDEYARGFDRSAVEDAELTYTLGFYPLEEAFDGQFHKLAVKVAGKSVDVRFRKGYFAVTAASGPQPGPAAINQLLQDPLDATAIGITLM
jgi:hypothetical protein